MRNLSSEKKAEMKREAIKRMRMLHIYEDAINQFEESGTVMVSEPPFGGLYWLNEKEQAMVDKFEREHDALVYMIVRQKFEFGLCDAILYVGAYKGDWKQDREFIKEDGLVFSYVVNNDDDTCSEFGTIQVVPRGGGLIRVA